ncbi:uncharacterized protein LTR77_007242 [Saxophila tyrrhenica]|uniref:Uncharacterized protein n=1 Tax=Saxophila tyrrhenica TaxID=1690608 RepID=A0AAV9P449_9PEZI|nr:hypothetical protein LTR77_007242 [Saxophila tyrrhenica]
MSTAYPPRLVKYLFSSKKQRDAARTTPMKPGFYGNFPSTFGLYYLGHGTDFLSLNFLLATLPSSTDSDPQRQDLYAVTFHKGPGTVQCTIYSSLTHGSTPLAVATNEKRYGNHELINLPPSSGNSGPRTERLTSSGFASNAHTFVWEGEQFEIREEPKKRPKTIRVVHVSAPSAASSDAQGEEGRPVEPSGKHEETVTTWTEGSIPNREGRLAIFKFAESNPVERFGEAWGLFCVVATLAICQRGAAIEGTRSWHEEKMLEKGNFGK